MPPRPTQMSDRALLAIIDQQIDDSVNFEQEALTGPRAKAIKYFEGDATLDGDVVPQVNRSSVVSKDFSDTHGWVLPSLVRTILGSDRVVRFEPRRKEMEEEADQATDFVNYVFMNECSGYSVLYSALWDGLALRNGIIKHWHDDAEEYRIESLSGQTEIQFLQLVNDPTVEVLEHTAYSATGGDGLGYSAGAGPTNSGGMEPQPFAPGGGGDVGLVGASTAGPIDGGNLSPDATGGMPIGGVPTLPPGGGGNGAGTPGFSQYGITPQFHDLKIRRKVYAGCLRVMAVPQEEFRIDPKATALDEDHVRFCAHVSKVTRSSLLVEGYDPELVDDLLEFTGDDTSRQIGTRGVRDIGSASDHSTELIEKWECYLQIDYDGDGVAEWRRIVVADGKQERAILLNEEWGDDLPFTDLVPDPMPHQWQGRSLFDETADIQRIKTVLWRGVNDNMYWVNDPMYEAVENAVSPGGLDRLSNPKFGAVVNVRSPGAITPLPVPFVADKLMAGLDLADKIREFRTGVSAATMALDPEALTNQTATAVNAARTASYTKIETYARNIAEVGLKRLFGCILKLIVKHQDVPRTIRLRGEWVEMNPRGWDADMDVIIDVGLGSGSRDRDLAMLQAVAQKQELVVQGLGPMLAAQLGMGPDVVFNTYRKMVEAAGIKSPDSYFPNLTRQDVEALMQQMQQPSQAPDPKAQESQARMQALQAQTQAKIEADRAKLANETQAQNAQMSIEWQRQQQQQELDRQHRLQEMADKAEARLAEIRTNHEFALDEAQRKHELMIAQIRTNAELKLRELEMEAQLKQREIDMRPQTAPNIQEVEP